jgi:urea transport system permease protein
MYPNDYYESYPVYRKIDSRTIKADELVKVRLSRADRLLLKNIMPAVNLLSSDKDVRIQGYAQICDLKQTEMTAFVKEALLEEKNVVVRRFADKTLNTLLLFAGNDKEQGEAIRYFIAHASPASLQNLKEYAHRKAIDETNRREALELIRQIESHQRAMDVVQNVFSGLSLGSILIMISLGLSIIYGLAGIINMSHGEFIMIGAYTTFCVQQLFNNYLPAAWLDVSFFVSLPVSFVTTSLFGLMVERLVIKHLYSRPLESLLATWGISLILIQIARNVFGDLTAVKSPAILSGGFEVAEGVILPFNRIFIIGLTVVMFILVYMLFQKTILGVRIRAVTQNRSMSACLGINTKRIDMLTFMLGSGLAGVAGCAITLIGNVVPNMGQTYIVDSFLVVVAGGVGQLLGCVVSGLGIGIFSKIFEVSFEAVYGKVLVLVFIIIFLQYKPKGLFPDKGRVGDG